MPIVECAEPGNEMEETFREEYERAVRSLADMATALRTAGHDPEKIARTLHAERRKLAASFKARTPEPYRARIRERSRVVYGDERGPTVEMLRARGKTWEEISESACRPGPIAFLQRSGDT